jgi:DNA-binding NarL/FixJ family response regulator
MKRPETGRNDAAVGLLVCDHPLGERVGAALKSSGFRIAFQARIAEYADLASDADVVVVAGGHGSHGHQAFEHIRARQPQARVVACLPEGEKEASSVQWALDNGIDGVVWETRIGEALEATVLAVLAGQLVVPRDLRERARTPRFTNREKQTLSLMIMGLTNREIATKLFVSESTVKSHLNTAYRKLGVHSRVEATRLIADPDEGLGTGILAITGPGLKRTRGG